MKSPLPALTVVFGLFAAALAYASSPESIIVWYQEIGTDRTGAGARVSALHAADPENDTFIFALIAGEGDDDNANFSIAGNELRTTGSLTEGEYLIRLRATNQNEKSVEEAFVISVVPGKVVPKVAAGAWHTVVLASDGTVFGSGSGRRGQLGDGNTEGRLLPVTIEDDALSGPVIVDVAAGGMHTVLLASDGTVFTFGAGGFGVLGHGDVEDRLVPVPVEHENLAGETVTELALGGAGGRTDRFHSLFLTDGGTVFTAGTGNTGQLGHGDTEDRLEPEAIEFFRHSGYRMLRIAYSGDGIGNVAIDGDPLSEAPFLSQYETGSEILLEGIPGEDSVFAGWTGDLDESAAVWTLVLDADVDLAAVFNLEERVRFEAAMAEAGLIGSDAGAAADPFGDGVPNLLKYAFNMDASGPDRRIVPLIPRSPTGEEAGLPRAHILHLDTGPVLRILFLRRGDSGLIYTPQTSTDLATWNPVTEEVGVWEAGPGWEWVVVNIPVEGDSFFRFGRVEVTLP